MKVILAVAVLFLATVAVSNAISITSISPTSLSAAGGYLTLTGTSFTDFCNPSMFVVAGNTLNVYTDTTKMRSIEVTSCTSTQVIARMGGSGSTTGAETVWFVKWVNGPYVSLASAITLLLPSITSISGSVPALTGGTITLNGNNFGSVCWSYTYISVQAGVGGSPTTCTNTQIIGTLPGGHATWATLYLGWAISSYVTYNTFSHSNIPSFTQTYPYDHTLTSYGSWSASLIGSNFGSDPSKFYAILLIPTNIGGTLYYAVDSITGGGTSLNFHGSAGHTAGNCGTNTYTVEVHWANTEEEGRLTCPGCYYCGNQA